MSKSVGRISLKIPTKIGEQDVVQPPPCLKLERRGNGNVSPNSRSFINLLSSHALQPDGTT